MKQNDNLQDLSIQRPKLLQVAFVVRDISLTLYADHSLPDFIHF